MAPDTLIDATPDFGRRVRERLTEESVAWLTTVGRDGTPQPNPVWCLWDGDSEVVVYTLPSAHRLTHIAERPQVALHLNSDVGGGDVAVLRGVAEVADDLPAADVSEPYLAKYANAPRSSRPPTRCPCGSGWKSCAASDLSLGQRPVRG
jgi:PPOX class probable F420-dependent enzyme